MSKLRHSKILKEFGKNIVKIRRQKNISQEELSFRTDISRKHIGKIERGESSPTLSVIYELAIGLDVPVVDLFSPC